MSLRLKLTLWYTGLLAILVIGFAVVHYYVVKWSITDEMKTQLTRRASDLSTTIEWKKDTIFIKNTFPWEQLEYKLYSEYAFMVQILDSNGIVLNRSVNLTANNKTIPIDLTQIPSGTDYIAEIEIEKNPFYTLYHPYFQNNQFKGWIQVGAFESRITSFLQMLQTWLIFSVPFGLLMSVLFGYYLSKKALAPIDNILKITDQIDSSHLNIRVPSYENETIEIKKLSSTLNSLLDRLAQSFANISDFTSDASHELLTPLTAMMGNIDVTLRRIRSSQDYEETLSKMRKDCQRMVETVRSLLFLARSEPPYELKSELVEIDNAVQEEIDNLIPLVYSNNLNISFNPYPVQANVNLNLFRQLIQNLISNAIKYSNSGGNISVSISKNETTFQVIISDQGCGIPKDSIPRLFDRFYRVDGSRQRKTGGTGLGLAIVKRIVDLHKGKIEISSEENVGTQVKVTLSLNV